MVQTNYTAGVGSGTNYSYTNTDVSNYTSQHSPTFNSATLGSPTIQANEEVFYDASQNPDNIVESEEDVNPVTGVPDDYYLENYGSSDYVRAGAIPQTNNYFVYGNSAYYRNLYPTGDYFSMSAFMMNYFTLRPWYDPFNPFFSPFYYNRFGFRPYARYGNYGFTPYWSSLYVPYDPYYYGSAYYGICLNNYSPNYSSSVYNNNQVNGSYQGGSRIIEAPRNSRSAGSGTNGRRIREVDLDRDKPNNAGGRILVNGNTGRYRRKPVNTDEERPGNPINTSSDNIRKWRPATTGQPATTGSNTIQTGKYRVNDKGSHSRNRKPNRTVNTRPGNRSNSSYNRTRGNTSPTRYRTHSPATYRSGSRSSGSPSRSSYRRSSSSPSRSSYSPSRSSNPSRSSYSPSRSRSPARSGGGRSSSSSPGRKRN